MTHEDLRIDGDRLLRRISDLAAIGPIDGGGSCRLALTDEDRDGLVTAPALASWMHKRVAQASDYKQNMQCGSLDGEGQFVFVLPGVEEPPSKELEDPLEPPRIEVSEPEK